MIVLNTFNQHSFDALCSAEDYTQYESSICVRDEPTASWSLLNRPAQLKFDGCEEKLKFPFLLAQLNYEPSRPQLLNVMRKIFKTLTSLNISGEKGAQHGVAAEFSSLICPVVGPHWERIGFQGLDPRTGRAQSEGISFSKLIKDSVLPLCAPDQLRTI